MVQKLHTCEQRVHSTTLTRPVQLITASVDAIVGVPQTRMASRYSSAPIVSQTRYVRHARHVGTTPIASVAGRGVAGAQIGSSEGSFHVGDVDASRCLQHRLSLPKIAQIASHGVCVLCESQSCVECTCLPTHHICRMFARP